MIPQYLVLSLNFHRADISITIRFSDTWPFTTVFIFSSARASEEQRAGWREAEHAKLRALEAELESELEMEANAKSPGTPQDVGQDANVAQELALARQHERDALAEVSRTTLICVVSRCP